MNFLLAKDSDFLSLTTMLIVRIIGGSMGTETTLLLVLFSTSSVSIEMPNPCSTIDRME